MKTTIQKYYDALLYLQKIGKIQNSTKFAKDKKISVRFILTCVELGLVEKINKYYYCKFKEPKIEMAENIIKVINEKNNIYYSKTPIQPKISLVEAIEIVKNAGLKVFKPVTEFKEL